MSSSMIMGERVDFVGYLNAKPETETYIHKMQIQKKCYFFLHCVTGWNLENGVFL